MKPAPRHRVLPASGRSLAHMDSAREATPSPSGSAPADEDATPASTATTGRPGGRADIAACWAVRGLTTFFAVLALTQPLTIGFFLDGHFPALEFHRVVGMLLLPVAAATLVAVLVACGRGLYPRWMMWGGIAMLATLVGQLITGLTRHTSGHLLPGVIILAGSWLWVVRAWRR